MRLKKLVLDVLFVGVVVLGLLVISQRAKSMYSERLNHNSLSQKAVIFKTKSHQSIQSTIQAIDQTKLNNFQVQFNVNNHLSYVYAKGKQANVPLKDGRFFSNYDFKSRIPVVVVGQSRVNELYQPASQAYYQTKNRYLSVIGVVGTNQTTSLDQHVFISASPEFVLNNRALNQVTVLVDDQQIGSHLKEYQKIFKTKSISNLTPKNTPIIGVNWLRENGTAAIILVLLIMVAGVLSHLFAQLVNGYHAQKNLTASLYRKYSGGQTQIFAVHLLSMTLIGFIIGSWFFYLTHLGLIFSGLVVVDLILIAYFYFRMTRLKSAH